ncbi:tetratricopeptide repeat protein [bacterium]|nr:tetratricopeptide repeat protein [bacterium]
MNRLMRVYMFGGTVMYLALIIVIILSCGSAETDAEALADLAQTRLYQEWDWAGAEQAFQQALEVNPKLGRAHAHYAWYLQLTGRSDESVTEMKRACEAEPQMPLWPAWLGWLHLGYGQYDKAIEAVHKSLQLDPNFAVGHYVLGLVYSAQGMYGEAIAAHERAAADSLWRAGLGHTYALAGRKEEALKIATELGDEGNTWNTWGLAEIYAAAGEIDEAFRWLETAYSERHPYIPWLGWNPNYASLRNDPRFEDLLSRMKLPDLAVAY